MNGNRQMPKPAPEKELEVAQPEEVVQEVAPQVSEEKPQPKKPVQSGIKVVAIGKGFYQGSRKVEGDQFLVPSMDKVGNWMKCVDPKAEAEHQKLMKEKKQRYKASAEK